MDRDQAAVALVRRDAVDDTPHSLVRLALERGAAVETLERLLALQERWDHAEAQRELVVALAKFKGECSSTVVRNATVDFASSKGRTHYKHATLDALLDAVTPHLSACGLSLTYEAAQNERGGIAVTTVLEHVRGGARRVTLTSPPDNSGNKNPIQQIASALTYLKRHGAGLVLGLAECDVDDGEAVAPRPEPRVDRARPAPPPPRDDEPAPLAVERMRDLASIANVTKGAGQIADGLGRLLAEHAAGKLTAGRAGAAIARAKMRLTELGWQEPQEWIDARRERAATKRSETQWPDDYAPEPPEREPGQEG